MTSRAAGLWNVTVATPMGEQTGTFAIEVVGERFAGTLRNPMMGEVRTEAGTIDGDRLTWTMALARPMPLSLTGEATIAGDTLTGSVSSMFGAMAFTGRRA